MEGKAELTEVDRGRQSLEGPGQVTDELSNSLTKASDRSQDLDDWCLDRDHSVGQSMRAPSNRWFLHDIISMSITRLS